MRLHVGNSMWELTFNCPVDEDETAIGVQYKACLSTGQYKKLYEQLRQHGEGFRVRPSRACDWVKARLVNTAIKWEM